MKGHNGQYSTLMTSKVKVVDKVTVFSNSSQRSNVLPVKIW